MTQQGSAWRHLLPGIFLVALGVLFLLDEFYVWQFGRFMSTWWPSLLIAFGVICLLNRPQRVVGPLILIAIGVIFQVERLDRFYWWSMHNLWPVILIVLGLAMLYSRMHPRTPRSTGNPGEISGEEVDAFVILGGLERAATSPNFHGGNATAILGGMDLDLTRAQLAPGENHLKVTAVFGGVEIRVPQSWQVTVQGTPLLGGIGDSRAPAAPAPLTAAELAAAPFAPAGRLVVDGFAMFGGIEVKN